MKDGKTYGTTDKLFLDEWYDYYKRGISFIEGGCYELALSDLREATRIRFADKAFARTYGMHFMRYFPHREMGYIFYLLGDEINAQKQLELSLKQQFSDKAQYYLNKVRSSIMKKKSGFIAGPEIILHPPFNQDHIWIKESPVIISASFSDLNYVSQVMLAGEPVFLSSSSQRIDLKKELFLDAGIHKIILTAKNLAGAHTIKTILVHIDRAGPIINIKRIDWEKQLIYGCLDDETAHMQLWIDNKHKFQFKGRNVAFSIHFKSSNKLIKLYVQDRLGNRTIALIQARNFMRTMVLLASAQQLNTAVYENPINNKPEIILYGWQSRNTVYTNHVRINGFFRGNKTTDKLIMNERTITTNCQDSTFFSQSIDLQKGDNSFVIKAVNKNEQIICSSLIHIFRKIPEPYQIKHRVNIRIPIIDLDIFDIPETIHCDQKENTVENAIAQLSCKNVNDFRDFFIRRLKTANRFQVSTDSQKNSRIVIYINIFETSQNIEIFIRFIHTETEHTFNIFDAYAEKNAPDIVQKLAIKLLEKIKRAYPLSEGIVVHANSNQLEIRGKENPFMNHWPMIIFRKNPMLYNPETGDALGADAEIISYAITNALIKNGCKAIPGKGRKVVISGDSAILK
jgi:hypothetical protein